MLVVGLTGNIASGKTTVARLLSERGATIIDADVLARRTVDPGTPAHSAIVARWGNRVLSADGTIDREALRRIVFGTPEELEALNDIVHPNVRTMRDELIDQETAARKQAVQTLLNHFGGEATGGPKRSRRSTAAQQAPS